MPPFAYTALDANGAYVKGKIDASTVKKAAANLEKEGFLIVNIKRDKAKGYSKLNHIVTRVTRLDRIFFTRHLYTLLESGIGLDQALRITAEQSTNLKFREILSQMHKHVESGQSLSSALAVHSKYFSNFFISLVKVGERSGKLDDVLLHILEQQENDYELLTKVRSAMIYPSLIVTAAITIVVFMMTFVVPKVASILSEYDVDLPLTTKVLIAVSGFMERFGIIALPLAIAAAVVFSRLWTAQPRGKAQWDAIKLKMPLLKRIVIEFNLARISRAMSSLMKSGIPMDQALELAASVSGNMHYQKSIRAGIAFVQKGVALSEVLNNYPKLYPPIATRMMETGERSGKLDHMFDRLARFYEKSVSDTLRNLSSVIEPLLLLFIGGIVGLLGIAILTPIWKFSETI